jgi:predicted dehydrogenase
MEPIRFAIVGGGWRAEFYLRIARALPERFQIDGLVVRDASKGAALEQVWQVRTYRTPDDLLRAERPSFVVTSVSWEANPSLVEDLAGRGLAILSETPPAPDVARMARLCALTRRGARVQVAEQYIYQPHHAARLAFAGSGLLGRVTQAQVSAAHGYHGLSLLRHFLGVRYECPRVTALRFGSPLVAGVNRLGQLPAQEQLVNSGQVIAWLDFGDRLGVFDFCDDQYFSWVRGQRLLVRGERGEIVGDTARYLADYRTPLEVRFLRREAGPEGNLEGWHLQGITAGERWVYRNPFTPGRLSDDEVAIASVLAGMSAYVGGGPEVYPLAEACQDRYLDLCIGRALESGQAVATERQPWAP